MQGVPKVVVRRLKESAAIESHPEPNLLGAFAEQSLPQAERTHVVEHLANCAACREVVAWAQPESEAAGSIAPVHSWVSWPVLRWGFAVGILVLTSVGVWQYRQRQKKDLLVSTAPPQAEVADSSMQSSSVPSVSSSGTPQSPAAQNGNQGIGNQDRVHVGKRPLASAEDASYAQKPAISAKALAEPPAPAGGELRSGMDAAVTARNQPPDQFTQGQAGQTQYQTYTNTDVVKAKAPVTEPASGSPQAAVARPAIPLQTSPALMLRASPRWTVSVAGGLQRSFDAGKTWEDVTVNARDEQAQFKLVFRAVAAVGPEVWAGGSGAVLYHSVDSGNRWQQVHPLADGGTPAGDITRVEFTDPQNGKFATSAGELWTTSDDGQTWRKQR
jgi:Photosynthesis system II assembly factor YCF48